MCSISFRGRQYDDQGSDKFAERDEAENTSCPGEADLGLEPGEDDGVDDAPYAVLITRNVRIYGILLGRRTNCGAGGGNKDGQSTTPLKPGCN